jgi:hypothetical protein
MKMITKKIIGTVLLLAVITTGLNAQVTIGSLSEPAPSAVLDLNTGGLGNLGFLLPRIALTSDTDDETIDSPAVGLMVYADGTGGLPAGIYVWDGAKWQTNSIAGAGLNVENPVTSFSLTSSLSVERWKTGKLEATNFLPENATLPYVSWQVISGGDNLSGVTATLNDYSFTAQKVGTAVVRATPLDGHLPSQEREITIWQNPVTSVSIDNADPLRLIIGNAATALTATVMPSNATLKTLDWSSQAPAIAQVSGSGDSWQVSGIAIGTTTITAAATDDSEKFNERECIVYPKINKPADITVTLGDAAQTFAVPVTNPGSSYQLSDFEISSSDEGVAKYNEEDGTISFLAAGTVTMTVQFLNYLSSAETFTVTVQAPCSYVRGSDGRCFRRGSATSGYKVHAACPSGWSEVRCSAVRAHVKASDWQSLFGSARTWSNGGNYSSEIFYTVNNAWVETFDSAGNYPIACAR